MESMKRIYTRTGDKGMTGIHGGERVFKDDIRIEANGCIDELNAVIGIVRSFLPQGHEWQSLLFSIQKNMMAVMSADVVKPRRMVARMLTFSAAIASRSAVVKSPRS